MHTLSVVLFLVAALLYTPAGFFLIVSLAQAARKERFSVKEEMYLACAGHIFVALGYLAGGY